MRFAFALLALAAAAMEPSVGFAPGEGAPLRIEPFNRPPDLRAAGGYARNRRAHRGPSKNPGTRARRRWKRMRRTGGRDVRSR